MAKLQILSDSVLENVSGSSSKPQASSYCANNIKATTINPRNKLLVSDATVII